MMHPHDEQAPADVPTDKARQPRKISRRASVIGAVLALAALAALAWLAWHLTHSGNGAGGPGAGPGGRRGMPATTVGVASAQQADIPVVLEALGTVNSPATVTVRPQVSGVLQKVLFKEGQIVKAGQLLATIDPRPFEMALLQATGQRQRDEAQLDNARIVLQRYKTLLAQDSIARQDVDTQAALVKQLEGTVTTDRAAEGTARLNLGYSKIAAPISGRVGLRNVDVGNIVNTGDANGIAVITQVSPIDVAFSIPQDQVPALREQINANAAMPVTALDRTRTDTLAAGNFLALDNQVDTQTGTVRAKARFTNDKLTLFPSQFVNVRLLMRTIQGAVVVPVTALRHGNNGDFVYVLNAADKTVSLRPVKRGQATVDRIQITEGLKAGEQVITEGADRLKDGARVVLPGDKPSFGGGKGGKNGGWQRGKRGADAGAAGANAGAGTHANVDTDKAAPNGAHERGQPAAGSQAQPPAAGASQDAAGASGKPTAEQRQRMLDQVKDDPEALARRKAFLDKIDQGDPQALARWQQMMQRRRGEQDRGQSPSQ